MTIERIDDLVANDEDIGANAGYHRLESKLNFGSSFGSILPWFDVVLRSNGCLTSMWDCVFHTLMP